MVAVLVNIAGSIFAILGISLYGIDLRGVSVAGMCGSYGSDSDGNCLYLAYIAEVNVPLKTKAGFLLYCSYWELLS